MLVPDDAPFPMSHTHTLISLMHRFPHQKSESARPSSSGRTSVRAWREKQWQPAHDRHWSQTWRCPHHAPEMAGSKKNDSAGRLQNPTFGYCGLSDDTPQISRVIIIHFPHQVWPYSIFIGCIFQTNPVGYGWDLCDFQCLCWHLEALDFGSGICSPENQFTWHQLAPDGFFQWLVPYQE